MIGVLFVHGYLNILLPSIGKKNYVKFEIKLLLIIDFYHISERNSCCSQFTNISNYINSTNKIMPFSSTTTNSSSLSTMLSSLIISVQWILLQIRNIFSLFCHIIGIPFDHYVINCLTYILNIFTIIKQNIFLLFNFNSVNNIFSQQSNNRYQRVSNNDIENINENKEDEQRQSIEL